MVSPFLFFPGERLSIAELTAACLDGILVPLGAGYIPADAVETPWMRARSIAPLVGERWAAIRTSAAWIHGGVLTEPYRHHVQRVAATRARAAHDARVVSHEVRLAAADVRQVAGVSVTSPVRTLVDLARSDDETERRAARAWGADDPGTRDEAVEWLARHPRFPFARRAADVLAQTGAGRSETQRST
ncbi:hypothetical protein QE430_002098 [Microbacterium testaceum]|uniref:hypothetical protein n=1 Tax=Microbacterium testaceum TaxID=2033 RepID=UPI0027861952|nr:hypothetical protein [Microbacterium testaceum]MDQ1173791.1 hypothetical protein [Microbacterium testaceum]